VREDKPEDVNVVKRLFNGLSPAYDRLEKTIEGRLHRELEWEKILKTLLPEDRSARILDAGGGTGRITLLLAQLGYQVTLCDLSSGMLAVAKEKLKAEGLLKRVEVKEADLTSLPFSDATFDVVVCLHGAFCIADSLKAAEELTRVLKRGGVLVVDTLSRYWAAIYQLNSNPDLALKLLKSERNHTYHVHGDWQRVFSPEELKELFNQNSITDIRIYGNFYQLPQLLPSAVLEKQEWHSEFMSQIVEILSSLGNTPSAIGMARELILVGKKELI
jgi:ubiquinone/menaquinone biosynthesis C-methylase UbiE